MGYGINIPRHKVVERDKLMINNKPFFITYYSASDKKTITRNALWTDKCRYWVSKNGRMLMTYFDLDANGYRTASDSWRIKL